MSITLKAEVVFRTKYTCLKRSFVNAPALDVLSAQHFIFQLGMMTTNITQYINYTGKSSPIPEQSHLAITDTHVCFL